MKILYMVQLTSSLHPQETPYKIQYLMIWITTLQPLSIKPHRPNSRFFKKKNETQTQFQTPNNSLTLTHAGNS